jgi:carbamate kinase
MTSGRRRRTTCEWWRHWAGTHCSVATARNLAVAATALAEMARDHALVVTHGNGPQVGWLARQVAATGDGPVPLDVLDAESEGMIGYPLEQELRNRLPGRDCAALLTQVIVDRDDPAFGRPTKPIGPRYTTGDAAALERTHGWRFAPDAGGCRRVVASPLPRAVVELRTIEILVEAGGVVVCAGGGGIPVVVDDDGLLRGVEAVVDKDRSAALLARELHADMLLLLTDVDGVFLDWGTPAARLIRRAHPDALRGLAFAEGSMGPKVEAALAFVDSGGRAAAIGALSDAAAVLRGDAGTTISASAVGLELAPAVT